MRVIVALVTAVAVTGCSLVLVDGPSPNVPRNIYPSCDESNVFPVIDAVLAGIYTLAAVGATTRDDDSSDRDGAVIGAAIGAALFGVSSWIGFGRTGECRARRQELRMQQGYPGYYPPPPGYYPPPPQGYPPPQPQGYPPPQPSYPPQVPASEGQACHPQLGCQAGLTCASGLCVQLPPAGTAP